MIESLKKLRGKMAGDKVSATESNVPTIKRLRPHPHYQLGRHLAFTIDENSIQMAAAVHTGLSVKLINAQKEYFVSRVSDPSGAPVSDKADRTLEQFVSNNQEYLQVLDEASTGSTPELALDNLIRDYIKRYGGRRPTISVTVTGGETALRTITMPKLKRRELDAALMLEARRQLPFKEEDCWIDYRLTESWSKGSTHRVKASALAATRKYVDEQLATFRNLNVEVGGLYHTQDVVGQLIRQLPEYDETRVYTLIDIQRNSTEISYFRGGDLDFYHVSSLGSSFLSNRTDPTVFEYFAESLATEIQNSLDYYSGQFSVTQTQEVLIYGDLCYTDDLIRLLTDRFGITFKRFPVENLPFVRNHDLPFSDNLAVCLPAVAAATNRSQIANLLPHASKLRHRARKQNRIGVAAVGLLVLALAGQWLGANSGIVAHRTQLADLTRQTQEFQSSEMFVTYNHLKRRLAANQAYLSKAEESPSYLSLNLREMSQLVPDGVRLYDLEFQADTTDRNMLVSGLIAGRSTPPEVVLAEFVENLSGSPFYDHVTIERHLKRREKDGFTLDFNLAMKGIL